jgi:tricarballylate dehydrogenase
MPNLWAIGEVAGGYFAFNYPGGSGLPKGAVYGRMAGREAALEAKAESKSKAMTMNGQNGHNTAKEVLPVE